MKRKEILLHSSFPFDRSVWSTNLSIKYNKFSWFQQKSKTSKIFLRTFLWMKTPSYIEGGKGDLPRPRFTESKLVLSNYSRKIKSSYSRFTKNECHFWHELMYYVIWKLRPSTALADVFIVRPLLVLRAAKRNPSKDDCPVTATQYCSLHILNHGSRRIKYILHS